MVISYGQVEARMYHYVSGERQNAVQSHPAQIGPVLLCVSPQSMLGLIFYCLPNSQWATFIYFIVQST